MEPNTLIFPRCGLTYGDLLTTVNRHRNRKTVAVKLGVSENQLDRVVKRHNLDHLFGRQPGEVFIGITASELLRAARQCANMSEAALRFGIPRDTFARKMKEMGATDYFKRQKPRKRRVSKRQITSLARQGYTRPDVAYLLGIKPSYLKDLIALWDLASEFTVKGGQAAAVTLHGYAWQAGRRSRNSAAKAVAA